MYIFVLVSNERKSAYGLLLVPDNHAVFVLLMKTYWLQTCVSLSDFLQEIEEAASRILDLSGKVKIIQSLFEFDPAVRYLEFEPESWQGSGWKVESIKYPAVVCELYLHIM